MAAITLSDLSKEQQYQTVLFRWKQHIYTKLYSVRNSFGISKDPDWRKCYPCKDAPTIHRPDNILCAYHQKMLNRKEGLPIELLESQKGYFSLKKIMDTLPFDNFTMESAWSPEKWRDVFRPNDSVENVISGRDLLMKDVAKIFDQSFTPNDW